jgi:ribosomal protein S18 acetylase RimI-like enzyme
VSAHVRNPLRTARVEIRRLERGDEEVVRALTDRGRYESLSREAATRLLAEERNVLLVAQVEAEPVGFVLAYELQRRHGPEHSLFVYEIEVDERHGRQGVGRALMSALFELARARGIGDAFVITDESNAGAMAFYESFGATRQLQNDVVFDFRL